MRPTGVARALVLLSAVVILVSSVSLSLSVAIRAGVPVSPLVRALENGAPPRSTANTTLVGEWIQQSATFPAPHVQSPVMAFSPEIGRSLLYLAAAGNATTWTYDAQADNWSALPDPSVRPYVLIPSMVYDPSVGRMVLFGGVAGQALLGETNATWLYDPRNNTWQNVTPLVSPPPRFGAGMTYDANVGRVIVFGGNRFGCIGMCIPETPNVPLNDTWSYDAAHNTWTNVTSSRSPPARANAGMAYEPVTGRVVLFGGVHDGGSETRAIYNDTWLFDAASEDWTPAPPSAPVPSPRGSMVMAYDPDASGIVLFGGSGSGGAFNDTWWYWPSVNRWALVSSNRSPAARYGAPYAYDSTSERLILLAGMGTSHPFQLLDLWLYEVTASPLVAELDASRTRGTAPLTVSFHAAGAGGKAPYTFVWTFGDGAEASGPDAAHVYASAGTYTVVLAVEDAAGDHSAANVHVVVSAPAETPGPALSPESYAGFVLAVALGAVAASLLVLRRRRRPGR